MFAGDLVEEGAPPSFGSDCHPFGWPVCNARMLEQISSETTVVPGHGDVVDRDFVERQCADLAALAGLIRELRDSGVDRGDAIAAGRGRWPFPEASLVDVVDVGYATRA